MIPLLPKDGVDLDPITTTWLRGLVATALELRIPGFCWHIENDAPGEARAVGYVDITLIHEAPERRRVWADLMGLEEVFDAEGRPDGYIGRQGALTIHLPDAVDPHDHCAVCGRVFDPRDTRPDGRARYQNGETCCSCIASGNRR